MKTLKGKAVASGIVKGMICLYSGTEDANEPHYGIREDNVATEIKRLEKAYEHAKEKLTSLLDSSRIKHSGESAAEVIKAHIMLLEDDSLFRKIVSLIENKKINAEHATSDVFDDHIDRFEEKDLHFSELANDIKDVKTRLLFSFSGTEGGFACPKGDKQAVVVVTRRLTPSMVMSIPKEHVLAFVSEEGGYTTHASILAKSYNVPIIFGVKIDDHFSCGDKVIVDGSSGSIIIHPDKKTEEYYSKKIKNILERKLVCAVKKEEPSKTRSGERISLKANITIPGEMSLLKNLNYDGIGLLRTEFLFSGKKTPPTEEEQFKMYKHILQESNGLPVTVRLLDIGGDKLPVYLNLPHQDNPDLGIRGARALDLFHDIYLEQIKALLRAAAYGDLRILYPMVSDSVDVISFKTIVKEARSELRKEKKKVKAKITDGLMIETPAAAIMAESLLNSVSFANIGSNDLLQYTLAAERGNVFVEERYHVMHPALIKLIVNVVRAGKQLQKEICLCGEISSFEEYYPVFLGIGLKSFSVSPSKIEDIKCHVLHEKGINASELKKFYKHSDKKSLDKFFQ